MFFIIILISTFATGCLLTIRHPQRRWHLIGRVFIAASLSLFFALCTWNRTPLDIFLICTFAGGVAWEEILHITLLARRRKKRFPLELTQEDGINLNMFD